jgi:putative DNA primase/helicase
MKRKTPDDAVQRLRSDLLGIETDVVKRRNARWAKDVAGDIKVADPAVPDKLHDRAQDNWRPLIAIADAAGGPWPSLAREAAEALCSSGDGDASIRVQLLGDIHEIFISRSATKLPSEDLAKALGEMIERPWPEWSKGRPITQRQIAKLLKPFKIEPRLFRNGLERHRGYDLSDLKDALRRYTGNLSVTP